MGFQQANRSIVTLPSIHSKTIHYGPDGTGRDTYIKYEPWSYFFWWWYLERTDEGGTMPIFTDYSPKRPDFISSLRFYQQQRNLNSRDFFSRSQFSLPTTELHKLQERVKVQKALTSRLTAPMKNSHCKLPAISIKT